jgi:hypothetical protein
MPSHLIAHWFLDLMIFGPEDGGNTLLRNVCTHMDYIALYRTSWQHSPSDFFYNYPRNLDRQIIYRHIAQAYIHKETVSVITVAASSKAGINSVD